MESTKMPGPGIHPRRPILDIWARMHLTEVGLPSKRTEASKASVLMGYWDHVLRCCHLFVALSELTIIDCK
jgi:hypothetical protein